MIKAFHKVFAVAAILVLALMAGMFAFSAPPNAYADGDLTGGIIDTGSDALERAKSLIGELPADPEEIDDTWESAVEAAAAAYEAAGDEGRAELDATVYKKEQTYGRWLESAQWALAAHSPLDSSTLLVDGDYTKHASSKASMGKSTSARAKGWFAEKVRVAKGETLVTISCDSESAFRTMRVGGELYTAKLVDGVPTFTVPLPLNAAVCFLVDTTDRADSIAYQITVSVSMTPAKASAVTAAKKQARGVTASSLAQYEPASATAVKSAAKALAAASKKKGVTAVELLVASEALDDALANAVERKTDAEPNPAENTPGDSGTSGTSTPPGAGARANAPTVIGIGRTTSPSAASTPGAARPKAGGSGSKSDTASKEGGGSEAAEDSENSEDTGVTAASAIRESRQETAASSQETASGSTDQTGIVLGGCIITLLLAGMCIRSVLFARAKAAA